VRALWLAVAGMVVGAAVVVVVQRRRPKLKDPSDEEIQRLEGEGGIVH
jgi:hypothetical protein